MSSPTADPASHDEARLLEHSYDGIQEFDNPLPGWWLFLFWAAIVFSPFYAFYYHVGVGDSVQAQYETDMKAYQEDQARRALELGEATEEGLLTLMSAEATMAEVAVTFQENCVVCHAQGGAGNIGPNLTDDYWIHGPQLMDVYRVIDEGGREGKGMEAWGEKLPPLEIRKLAAYVGSLRGTQPANPKDPEGDLAPYDPSAN